MKILVAIATLFVIGSVVGYIIELLFRRFISQKRWVNPGFMVGPYIPLYGFGTIILYGFSSINLENSSLPKWASILLLLLFIGIAITLIELVAGLIFIKGLHLKLWDYSDQKWNFKGLICPLFSFIWFACASIYYFFLNPILIRALFFIAEYPVYVFFVGIVVGMMIVDLFYSLHLGIKIKKFSNNATIKFDDFKASLSKKHEQSTKKHIFYPLHLINKDNIKDLVKNFIEEQSKKIENLKNKKDDRK